MNGAADLRQYLAAISPFRLDGRAPSIRCPVLATAAEEDPQAADAQQIVEALSAPATLLRFTTAEGAGAHCEMQNRWLANQRILDWLDETFGPVTPPVPETGPGSLAEEAQVRRQKRRANGFAGTQVSGC